MVSIIIPAYNAGAFLAETLQSVLVQTCTDWEILVIDDGSTDHTAEVASSFADSRLRLIRQPNAGVSRSRNKGLELAGGEYLLFLDADDLLTPEFLAIRVAALGEHHPAVAEVQANLGALAFAQGDLAQADAERAWVLEGRVPRACVDAHGEHRDPVAFGVLDAGLHWELEPGECGLWDFATLPAWRGRGMYPCLLQAIFEQEAEARSFWIGHLGENTASRRGICAAGFQLIGLTVVNAAGVWLEVPRGPEGRAYANPMAQGLPFTNAADEEILFYAAED